MNVIKTSLERLEKKDTKIKLNITKSVLDQVRYLCNKIPNLEWSGILFYEVEGSIKDPENMVINTVDILPLDKGTAGFTSFSSNITNGDNQVKVSKHWMRLGLDKKQGTIHSHNTMAVFASGTDWSEIEDNTPNHNYYLFVIVNNKLDIMGKVAYVLKSKMEGQARDDNGEFYNPFESEEKNLLVVYDCDVNIVSNTIEVSEEFESNVADIMKPKAVATSTLYSKYGSTYIKNDDWNYTPSKEFFTKEPVYEFHEEAEKLAEEGEVTAFLHYLLQDETTVSCEDYLDILKIYGATPSITPTRLVNLIKEDFSVLYNTYFSKNTNRYQFRNAFIGLIIGELEEMKEVTPKSSVTYKFYQPLINMFNQLLK